MAKAKKNIQENPIPADAAEKQKMADLIVGQIKSSFGQGSIMKMTDVVNTDVDVISTGSLSLDLATGIGGIPRGRVVEIFGPESSGKTSLALSAVAQAQKKGGIAAFVDAEHALDPEWASRLGVNVGDLYVSQPNNGEEALEIVDNLVRSNAFDIVVVDSVAALVPKSELEGNMGDSQMGVQARLMSQALRKLTGAINKSKTVVVFINQIRMKIGVMFGNPETTTGGQALKFFSSQRFDVRKVGNLKSGEEQVGVRVRVKVVKNKMAAPFRKVEFDMMFSEPGVFSIAGEVIDVGSNFGVVEKRGNTYSLTIPESKEPIKLGVGRDNAKNFLYQNKVILEKARKKIMDEFKNKVAEDREAMLNANKTDMDLNNDGKIDEEDYSIAGKTLNDAKQAKKEEESKDNPEKSSKKSKK